MLKQKIENQKAPLYAFGGLDEKELNTLYNLATTKTLRKDEVLFAEGDTDQTLYVVLEGEIRVVKHLHGQQTETVSTLRDGAWVGEIGFTGKIPRIIPAALAAEICKNSWPIPKIFHEIKKRAALEPREMFSTFNMGIGMVLVVAPQSCQRVIRFLKQRFNLKSWEIGQIVKGKREVLI